MDKTRSSELHGKNVFVSRAQEQSKTLCRELELRGARPVLCPMIRFGPPEDPAPLDNALRNLRQFDWLIFTSQVAVESVSQRAEAIGVPLSQNTSCLQIAAVGPATAEAAARCGLRVRYVARKNQGSAFVEELSRDLSEKRILLPRSNLAAASTVKNLERAGSHVTDVVAYRTLPPSREEHQFLESIEWDIMDAALFFSPSAVHNFVDVVGIRQAKEHQRHVVFAAVGPVTAEALGKLGFANVIQASNPSTAGVIRVLEDYFAAADVESGTRDTRK